MREREGKKKSAGLRVMKASLHWGKNVLEQEMYLITKWVFAWKFWPWAQRGPDCQAKLSSESKVIRPHARARTQVK